MNDAVKIRIALHGTLYLSGDTLEDYVHFSVVHPMCMSASPGHAHGRTSHPRASKYPPM